MDRYDIINHLIKKENLISYLEIGLRDPNDCFNKINCASKMSVDPGFELRHGEKNKATFEYTSDEFFEKLGSNKLGLNSNFHWDIIFIDGLHISEQVYKDFINSKNHCNRFIVFHDMDPPTINHARENYDDTSTFAGTFWNGTSWKAIQKIRKDEKYFLKTVSSDWGVSILDLKKKNKNILDKNFNEFYEYNIFDRNKKEVLNLITPKEFINNYNYYFNI